MSRKALHPELRPASCDIDLSPLQALDITSKYTNRIYWRVSEYVQSPFAFNSNRLFCCLHLSQASIKGRGNPERQPQKAKTAGRCVVPMEPEARFNNNPFQFAYSSTALKQGASTRQVSPSSCGLVSDQICREAPCKFFLVGMEHEHAGVFKIQHRGVFSRIAAVFEKKWSSKGKRTEARKTAWRNVWLVPQSPFRNLVNIQVTRK